MDGSFDQLLCNKVHEIALRTVQESLKNGDLVQVNINYQQNPLMSYAEFAQMCDVSPQVVRGWAENPRIPEIKKVKIGKRVMIDLDHYRASKK